MPDPELPGVNVSCDLLAADNDSELVELSAPSNDLIPACFLVAILVFAAGFVETLAGLTLVVGYLAPLDWLLFASNGDKQNIGYQIL